MSGPKQLSRRQILQLLGVSTGATVLGACGGTPAVAPAPSAAPAAGATSAPAAGATAAAATGAKKYEGVTLRMLTQAGVAYEPAFVKYAKDFEAQTGAKVEFEFAAWETLMPKVQADLATGSPQFDMFANDVEFQYTIYPNLLPINDLMAQKNITTDDFFPFVKKYGEGIAGQTGVRYGLPVIVGVSSVFYRTDLIDQLPTTWADYEKVLAANTGGGKYGLSFAGVPAQLVKLFLARYWSQGDPLLTPDWKPLINGEKGVKAVEMLLTAAKQYAPPGVLGWDNPDASNAFLNGDVAVMEGWGSFILGSIDDPAKSKVVGKWAIGPYPENGTGNVVQHNIVIFKHSKNPEAAFDFMAYAASPEAQKEGAIDFGMDVARQSIYSDPEVTAKKPYLPDFAKVLNAGKPVTPGVPQWLEMFIGLGEGLSAALSEQTSPQEALDGVAQKWVELIEQNPLDFEYRE